METKNLRVWSRYIIYIKGKNNIFADRISRILFNGNQETINNSTYQKEIVLEINYIEELPECSFPINFNPSKNINGRNLA